jgi:hypothetical protein
MLHHCSFTKPRLAALFDKPNAASCPILSGEIARFDSLDDVSTVGVLAKIGTQLAHKEFELCQFNDFLATPVADDN